MAIHSWIYRRLLHPFVVLLKHGMSPEKIALTVALGVSLGVIPVIGSTTMLCTLAAIALRLNLPAIMLVNGVVYPMQLTLLVPFLRAGAWLFRVEGPKLTITQIFKMIRANAWHATVTLFSATMHALVVWFIAGCLTASLVYLVVVTLLRRLWVRRSVIN